jgi:transcriptional regulator with PAS, ATPase and Fis domain
MPLQLLTAYRWPGNVRQLRNIVEQMSVIEQTREVDAKTLRQYLPDQSTALVPTVGTGQAAYRQHQRTGADLQVPVRHEERPERVEGTGEGDGGGQPRPAAMPTGPTARTISMPRASRTRHGEHLPARQEDEDVDHTEVEESLSLEEKEKEMIRKALVKHRNKRKNAAQELGISERTLYRKIKEYEHWGTGKWKWITGKCVRPRIPFVPLSAHRCQVS